uniref:Uncharacterized protein n=1 Tax=Arundo donax TaxID=35708 RepID=A0A0A9FGN0_ARUDO
MDDSCKRINAIPSQFARTLHLCAKCCSGATLSRASIAFTKSPGN